MVGKEVNETAQPEAEGTVWGNSAAEDVRGPSSLGDFENVIHPSH
jgi:hypothetical protein